MTSNIFSLTKLRLGFWNFEISRLIVYSILQISQISQDLAGNCKTSLWIFERKNCSRALFHIEM